jgi:CPA1 family monovalent cation:H+ antiporter
MRNADALVEGARSSGRIGYKRAAEAALGYPLSFRAAYFLYRRLGVRRVLADRLGERFETLLVTRMLVQRLAGDTAKHARSIFGERIEAIIDRMLKERLDRTQTRLDSLRRQYADYLASLEARILRQSALRREMGRYKALYEEGLIASEVYRDLTSKLENAQDADAPPRFDIGLDTDRLIARLDLFAALEAKQLEGVRKLLRARFTVPNELIVRKGERGDAVYFIASGAVDVIFSDRRIPLGSGDFFGEMALITGEPRQADVRAQTYSRLLVLRKSDFDRFMRDHRDVRLKIREVAERRLLENRPEAAAAT